MDPFARDGRLSESALRRIAAEAAGARRHVSGGTENHYTTPGGMVQVPTPSKAVVAYSFTTPASGFNITTASYLSFQQVSVTYFNLLVPAGTYFVSAQIGGIFQNSSGVTAIAAQLWFQLTSDAGSFNAQTGASIAADNLQPAAFFQGTAYLQQILTTTASANIGLQVAYTAPSAGAIINAQVTSYGNGTGTSVIALKLS